MKGTQDGCVCAVGTAYVPTAANGCVVMKGSKRSSSTGAGPWKDLRSPPAALRPARPALGSSWWTHLSGTQPARLLLVASHHSLKLLSCS